MAAVNVWSVERDTGQGQGTVQGCRKLGTWPWVAELHASQGSKPLLHAPLSQWPSLKEHKFKDELFRIPEGNQRALNPVWTVCTEIL